MKKLIFTALLSLLVLGGYAQKKTLKSAQKELNKENYDGAIELANQAAANEETKNNPEVYLVIAKANLSKYKENKSEFTLAQTAFDNYQKVIELDKSGKLADKLNEAVVKNGEMYLGGEHLKLMEQYLLEEGNKAFNEESYESGLNAFSLANKITPNIQYDFYSGYCAYQLDKSEIAASYYEKVIQSKDTFDNKKYAYNGLIDIYYAQNKDFDKALEVIGKAKAAYPEEKLYKDYEIEVLIEGDRLEKAIKELENTIASGNAAENTYYVLGYLLWNKEDYVGALNNAKKALEMKPDYYDALYIAGTAVYNMGAKELKKANETEDNDKYTTLREEAKVKFREAMPYFEKAIQLKPDDIYSLNPLSAIYDQLGMDDKRDALIKKIEALEAAEGGE